MGVSIEFNCTKCGKCCHGPAHAGVRLTDIDATRLLRGIGPAKFQQSVKAHGDNLPSIRMRDGKCIFLVENKCSVYDVRPDQCRSFPFWQGLWTEPGRHALANCEGLKVIEIVEAKA